MFQTIGARLSGLVVALALMSGTLPAVADNLPGSPGKVIPELTETATEVIVGSIKDNMRPLREPGGGAGVTISTAGAVEGFGASLGRETPLALRLNYRDISTADLDGSIVAGSILLGRSVGERTLVFGGIVTERLDADTLYNDGTIGATGVGLALGADHKVNDRLFLTAILGVMDMDYDVSRSNGAVFGTFDARRSFIDLSGDYMTKAGAADLRLGFGLLYVRQANDSYLESGGDLVDAFTSERLSGKLSARSFWGTEGSMRPYVDVEGMFRLSGSTGLPTAFDTGDVGDWSARLGVGIQQLGPASGFDVGLGMNFGDDDFEGFDANLRYVLRF